MRKKTREVNIFSASVVDLFASGLGVFLIVSIIALKNQGKKVKEIQPIIEVNKDVREIEKLKEELNQMAKENLQLKAIELQTKSAFKKEMKNNVAKHLKYEKLLEEKISRLEDKMKSQQNQIKNQNKMINQIDTNEVAKAEVKRTRNKVQNMKLKKSYAIGDKIQLNNVQFYPGTDRAIEPYASNEILAFTEYLKENPQIKIEVSGHIFETKTAIERGLAEDTYNLSVKRAKYVCQTFEKFGISSQRLTCVGYGATRPILLTDDEYSEAAQKNRRVEIEILSSNNNK